MAYVGVRRVVLLGREERNNAFDCWFSTQIVLMNRNGPGVGLFPDYSFSLLEVNRGISVLKCLCFTILIERFILHQQVGEVLDDSHLL